MSTGEWIKVTLGEVCDFSRGLTYKKKDEVDQSSNAVLRANNITLEKRLLNFDEIKYISDDIDIPDSKIVKKDTILICTASGSKSHLGKTAHIDDDYGYAFGGFMGLLIPKQELDAKYLYWITNSKDYLDFIAGLSDGVNINNLTFSQLSEFNFPLPLLQEQKRIVAILDQAFAGIYTAIANTEKNLTNAHELFESYLNAVFTKIDEGWQEKKLGDQNILQIVDGDRGKNYPKKSDFSDTGFCLFLNTKNVRPDGFNFDTLMFVTKEKDKALRKGKLKRRDVVITTRGTIGNIAIYDDSVEFNEIRLNSGMLIFRPNEKVILSEYLFEILRSSIIKSQIARYVSGAAQPQLPIKTLVNFTIPVPVDLDEQKKIVDDLRDLYSNTQQLEYIYKQKLNSLNELKQSLLQKAFSGELTAEDDKLMDEAVA